MASEDVKMGNIAPGAATEETCAELVQGGLQSKTDSERKAGDNDVEGTADVHDEIVVGGGTTASAKTPVSANGEAAATDTAGTPGGSSGRKVHTDKPTREDAAAVERLRAYVTSLGGTLPEGWIGVYRMRMSGTSAGQYDLHYRSPEGRLIRSRAEVLRILGLDPSGGAAKKASAGKGSKNAADAQQAEVVPATAGAALAANPASPGNRSGSGAAVSRWTLPLELSRKEALQAAKERAVELGLKPPFITDRGVTILSLGSFHKAPGFYDATHIWPLGYRAAWIPQHNPAAASPGAKKKSKKKETSTDKGAAESGNSGKAAADGGDERPESGADAVAAAAAPPPPPQYRFVSEIRPPNKVTGDGPCFAVLLECNPDAPSTANGNILSPTEPMLVHIAIAPDVAWSAIPDLQAGATAVCKRAKPNGTGVQPTAMQRALASMPPVIKAWGMDCFGLSDIRVLQLLEALPGVESCEDYLFVQQRNSWELEATAISTKRNVVLSASSNRRAAAAASKQRKRQQQLSIEAFVDRSATSPKPDGTSEQEARDGLQDAAAATPGAAGTGTGKKSTTKLKTDGKTPASGSGRGDKAGKMTREDLEIRGVLDRLVERVSLVMTEPDEKERQKMLKAMEKLDRAAARRREKTAEKAAEKAAAAGTTCTGATEIDKEKDKGKQKEKDKENKTKEKSIAKSRATKEKDTAGAAAMGASEATEAVPDGSAAAPLPQLPGNQVDERALPTAELPAPPGMPLELSYAMGGGNGVEVDADAGISSSVAASTLSTAEVQQLLKVYQFLWDHRKLLGLEGRVPSLADLLAVVSEPPARLSAPARRAADEIHLSVVRLLVGEALDELLAYTAETTNLHRRDLSTATPPITAATWPELARRYLAAAAAARYLATSEPRSSALASVQLPGQLQNLEPADWLHYLLAGLNFPHLLSRIALLPHASSRWAADALLAADDARARAAAERALQGVKSFDLQHLDGEGQVRRGRRLLHTLLTLPEGGEQLGFYAPEFGEVLRAPRGLDLHMVAVRLDAGLYQSTGDWLQALATDVRSALALWRAALSSPKSKDIPGHQDARADLADEAERVLNELLLDPDSKLALQAPVVVIPKIDDDAEMQDACVSGKGQGKDAKPQKSRSARKRKQQTEEGGQAASEEDDVDKDPASLDDPTRLFNPRDGCRICWLDEDKNRILLCDGCDGEYHCYCVEPPLLEVPDGSWFCSSCTARGLGLPKAEDESEDPMDVDAALDRRTTPRAITPSRIAAATAAGGASISPSDDSAAGTAPCSPAFQHCHSHSHLVSDLHDRAEARRHKSRIGPAAADAPVQGLPAAGCVIAGAEKGEAPLSIPDDVPEGPRVTLRANTRPGLQELQGLLQLAHLLGNYDYATGGPVGISAGPDSAGNGWTPARRLALLSTLCELAMDTNALRSSLDEIVETRKKARVEVNAIKSKARQIQEEQALAKKAAAEKENAPKAEKDSDAHANANMGAGTTGVAAGKSAKGGKAGGAKGSTKDAKAKGNKTEKDVEATAKESKDAADDHAGGQETKIGKEGGEITVTKSRSKSRTDVSVLPEDELKRLMSLELQVEGLAIRHEALGEDRHGSRYWWLGADHLNLQGPQGVILVEQLPPGQAIAEQAKASQAFSERQIALQKEEEAQRAAEEAKKMKVESAVVRDAGDLNTGKEQELDEWGLPKERRRPRTVAIGFDAISGQSWALYHSPKQLNTVIGWLNPKGIREGPLRTALLRIRDRIAASQAPAAASTKQKQPPSTARYGASQGEHRDQSQEEAMEGSVEGGDAFAQPPPQLLCPAVTLGTAGGRRGGGGLAAARQGSLLPTEGDAAEGAPIDSPETVALRTELLALHKGLPPEAFSRFWGSTVRQKQWFSFVEGATTPQQLCAALTVLEAMLVDEAFRPHWRLYCMPAQHPELCTTWAAAWYRLGGLQSAIRKQVFPQRELRHQPMVELSVPAGGGKTGKVVVGKKEKAAPGKKEQQALIVSQERTARRGGSVAPPLPDISNVRSREAAALLGIHGASGKAQNDAGSGKAHRGAGGGSTRGQKRHRSVAEDNDDEDSDREDEDEEDAENRSNDRNRRKRTATTVAKDCSRRPVAGSRSKGKVKEQVEDEERDGTEEEEVSDSDKEASASGSDDNEDDDDADSDEPSSDEGIAGRKRKAQPSLVATRTRRVVEKAAVKTRKSGRLMKAEPEDEDNSSESDIEIKERVMPKTRRSSRLNKACTGEGDSNSSDIEEEDAPPTKRSRGPAAAAASKLALAAAGAHGRPTRKSDVEDSDSERGQAGAEGRTRGRSSVPVKQTKGAKPGIGSRAAAILANRKRALQNWSEPESESSSEDNESSGSGQTSSSEDEQPAVLNVAVSKRGKPTTTRSTITAIGNRRMGKQQQQLKPRKPPPHRMARSEVEYDVEDFDDLNT